MTKKNPHAVALGRRGGQASSPAKAAASRVRMLTQWEQWRARGGRPAPIAKAVPEEHRAWLLGLTKVDLAELAWAFAEEMHEIQSGEPAGSKTIELVRWEVRELISEYGAVRLTRAKGRDYFVLR